MRWMLLMKMFMKAKAEIMALGGGNGLTQNKVLPGSYINFSRRGKGIRHSV